MATPPTPANAMTMNKQTPAKMTIWSGAILGGIATATMAAKRADYQAFSYWNRNSYYLNGGDGREGVVTFAGGHWYADAPLVGVFHNIHSDLFTGYEVPLNPFFLGCPEYNQLLATQSALPYLRLRIEGKLLHRVTAAFWNVGELLACADSWPHVLANGANLLKNELTADLGEALDRWQTDYGMSSEQVVFVHSLFQQKMSRSPVPIELTTHQASWLDSTCEDEKPAESHRIWREMFREIGVVAPD